MNHSHFICATVSTHDIYTHTVSSWEIVKRWLDPRTQAKIQIMGSGPDTTKRLLEYISIDDLPKCYGGNAPDLFPPRVNIEYLHIARASTVKKVVKISSNQQLCIDVYLTEGDIQLEVLSSLPKSSTSTAVSIGEISAPQTEPHCVVQRDYEVSVATSTGGTSTVRSSSPANLHGIYDAVHKRPEGQMQPLRVQLDISVQQDATIYVFLTNSSKWSQKSLMLNIFTKTSIASTASVKAEYVSNPIAEQSTVVAATAAAATSGREALPSLNSPILVQPNDHTSTDQLSASVASASLSLNSDIVL